ncbi:hypothetical protein PMAYCL1PPCAC_19840, partial [Pristionchus mayeri]
FYSRSSREGAEKQLNGEYSHNVEELSNSLAERLLLQTSRVYLSVNEEEGSVSCKVEQRRHVEMAEREIGEYGRED